MNRLQFPQAKLFYGVAQLSKQGRISANERKQLKEKIVTENEEIFAILQRLTSEQELTDLLISLVKAPEPQPQIVQKVQQEPKQAQQVEASSPWGEFLRRKKKLHQNKHKLQANAIKATLINPQQTE